MPTKFGDATVPFGKHKGRVLNELSFRYIDWLITQWEDGEDWTTRYPEFFDTLTEYLNEPNIQREREAEHGTVQGSQRGGDWDTDDEDEES